MEPNELDPVTGQFVPGPRKQLFTAADLQIPMRVIPEEEPIHPEQTDYHDISLLPVFHTDGIKGDGGKGIMLQIKSIENNPDTDIYLKVSDSFFFADATLHSRYRMHIGWVHVI